MFLKSFLQKSHEHRVWLDKDFFASQTLIADGKSSVNYSYFCRATIYAVHVNHQIGFKGDAKLSRSTPWVLSPFMPK